MNALRNFLRSKPGAAVQIAILIFGLYLFRGRSPWSVLPVAVVALVLIWLTGDTWQSLGFGRPADSLPRWTLEGTVTGLLCGLIVAGVLTPVFTQIFDVSASPASHKGDVAYLVTNIILYGVMHALAKGLAYRAFLLHRLEALFGQARLGLGIAVVLAALVFGLSNLGAPLSTLVIAALVGLVFNLLFYWSHRNVWPTILAHGVYNATLFVLVFLGRL
jgi:hypothetical protein